MGKEQLIAARRQRGRGFGAWSHKATARSDRRKKRVASVANSASMVSTEIAAVVVVDVKVAREALHMLKLDNDTRSVCRISYGGKGLKRSPNDSVWRMIRVPRRRFEESDWISPGLHRDQLIEATGKRTRRSRRADQR